ncbi:MAG: bacterial/archaeal transporter family-2 protein [Solirubrobacteraceae bacterium]|nr:bacterial/archaeal transporter family-2 protein [Solirubrobacteraceae bacterium]
MLLYIVLACLNGMVVGTSRAINGGLSTDVGPLRASLWNHVVGFAFLTLILLTLSAWQFHASPAPPLSAYLGGFFGALFVAVNSYVFTRLGAMNAALLVISGQMISAVLIEYRTHDVAPTAVRWLGVAIVLLGVYLSRVPRSPRDKDTTQ